MRHEYLLKNEECELVVSDYGGALVSFYCRGYNYLASKFNQHVIESSQGQLLLPWPNRIKMGRYEHLGTQFQLPINEVTGENSIHGLIRWNLFKVNSETSGSLVMTSVLVPQQGYIHELEVKVKYELQDSGFKVTTVVLNKSETPAPFGMGWHPYFVVSDEELDECFLKINAESILETDAGMIPTNLKSVDSSDFDFRQQKPVGNTIFDTCYTDFNDESIKAIFSSEKTNRQVRLFADSVFGYLMVYSGDTVKNQDFRRKSIALEPMTCPPNAFNSKQDLILIEPGEYLTAWWCVAVT